MSATDFLAKAEAFIQGGAYVVTGIVVCATAAVRVVPMPQAQVEVDSVSDKILKALHYLPTIGINPRTQALEAEIAALRAQSAQVAASAASPTQAAA